jgi:hypothetical protein
MDYQFMRMETYGCMGRGAKKGRNYRQILGEANRVSHCQHVPEPMPPVRLKGSPQSLAFKIDLAYDHANKSGFRLRRDEQLMIGVVMSYPRTVDEMREHVTHWKKTGEVSPEAVRFQTFRNLCLKWMENTFGDRFVAALEHWDESHPHIHAYAVPHLEDGEKMKHVHPGLKAFAEGGATSAERHKAYRQAMRDLQQDFHEFVGSALGWERRKGVKRLTRAAVLYRKKFEHLPTPIPVCLENNTGNAGKRPAL